MKVYIIDETMSSPNHILESREITEITTEIDYKYKKYIRNMISSVRTNRKKPYYKNTIKFHTLRICREDQRPIIEASYQTADKELKNIEKSLHATINFLPIDLEEIRQGELYQKIVLAINARVIKTTLDKVNEFAEKKAGQLPPRSREALLKLIDQLNVINVFQDGEINDKMKNMREAIISLSAEQIRKDLETELSALTQRGAYIEL